MAGSNVESLKIEGLRSELAGPFDLELSAGEVVSISGASGSGKSLFLRMVADLDPHTGAVSLGNTLQSGLSGREWRKRVPYVAAESGWWRDNVVDHFEGDCRDETVELSDRFGVTRETFNGPVARLSTGERQRLSIIRALVLRSPVLLLDEPTGPLDPSSVEKVEEVLSQRLRQGAMILMVSHDARQGARLRARQYRMVNRRLEIEV